MTDFALPNVVCEGDGAHFAVGFDDPGPYWTQCVDTYQSRAGNERATEANKKKQGAIFMPSHWGTGKNKPLPLTKANAMEVCDGFCERAGIMKLMSHATVIRRIAWTLEGQRHRMPPSWVLTYGKTVLAEEALDVLEKCASTPALNADSSYVRFIVTGNFQKPEASSWKKNPLLWTPSFVLSELYVEMLSLAEAQLYCAMHILPPRILIMQTCPDVPKPCGYAIVIDLHCPCTEAGSYKVALALHEELQFNIVPHLYDVGAAGLDDSGLRSTSWAHLVLHEFKSLPFSSIARSQVCASPTPN